MFPSPFKNPEADDIRDEKEGMMSQMDVCGEAQSKRMDAEVLPASLKPSPSMENSELSSPPKRKLISLQYNLSDSEDEESREERKARVV